MKRFLIFVLACGLLAPVAVFASDFEMTDKDIQVFKAFAALDDAMVVDEAGVMEAIQLMKEGGAFFASLVQTNALPDVDEQNMADCKVALDPPSFSASYPVKLKAHVSLNNGDQQFYTLMKQDSTAPWVVTDGWQEKRIPLQLPSQDDQDKINAALPSLMVEEFNDYLEEGSAELP